MKSTANYIRKLKRLNVVKFVWNHLLNRKHSYTHRVITGSIIMLIGVLIAKHVSHLPYMHYIADMVGYAVHGVGAIPFVDKLVEVSQTEEV